MSAAETEEADICCASCGIAEVDDIKLMECDDCDLVRYCSDKCQQDHSQQHEAKCKERSAELRDENLFRQPESTHMGDCPICFLPLPLDQRKLTLYACCSKMVCNGCVYANMLRESEKRTPNCPFCRCPLPESGEESEQNNEIRVQANDPVTIQEMGMQSYHDEDYDIALEYWTKAAELGNAEAHYNLSHLYHDGEGVEKDEKKEIYHLVKAAIAGHPKARHNLGCYEVENGTTERAVKHWIIAANLGLDEAIQALMDAFRNGLVSKDDLATALRAHQAAVNATKSSQREVAENSLPIFYY